MNIDDELPEGGKKPEALKPALGEDQQLAGQSFEGVPPGIDPSGGNLPSVETRSNDTKSNDTKSNDTKSNDTKSNDT